MVQPVGAAIDFFHFPCVDVVEKELHRITSREALFHHLLLLPALNFLVTDIGQPIWTTAKIVVSSPISAFCDRASQKSLVAVHGRNFHPTRQLHDFARRLCIRIDGANDAARLSVFSLHRDVVDFTGLMADHDDVEASGSDSFDSVRF